MIAKLIGLCVRNRAMVVLLTVFVIAAGIWSVYHITVDAIPDLSDVQVVIRTEYPGQAPQIVEDQVTYPLTTAMLAVPFAKVVRGYSMFGTSFVYIIFKDGTDLYWARSRVLEQLSAISGKLPGGISPQLGPDATGVGWIYEYVLTTGKYCPDHPDGAWHDPVTDRWYASPDRAPDVPAVRERLIHHRVFQDTKLAYVDPVDSRRYGSPEAAPAADRDRLTRVVLVRGRDTCPLDGKPLVRPDLDLSELRSLQDWYLRYELSAVEGVSEIASHRRVRQAVSGGGGSGEAPRLQHLSLQGEAGDPALQHRRGGAADRAERDRVHGAGDRLSGHPHRRGDRPGQGVGGVGEPASHRKGPG